LRADLLPPAQGTEIKRLLREYLDTQHAHDVWQAP